MNERLFGGVAKLVAADADRAHRPAAVDPRLMSFLACTAALGVLMMKGLVESLGDPLRYSDDLLIDGLASIFEAAAPR